MYARVYSLTAINVVVLELPLTSSLAGSEFQRFEPYENESVSC